MIKEPKTLTILGKPYEVVYLDDSFMNGKAGSVQGMYQKIAIHKSQAPEQMQDTLMHEVIHVIDGELALGLDEPTIQRLACGLHSAGFGYIGKSN